MKYNRWKLRKRLIESGKVKLSKIGIKFVNEKDIG